MIDFRKQDLKSYILEGQFGLERENLRVDKFGFISQEPHPFEEHPYIEKDFSESQVEIITPVCKSIEEMYQKLEEIHDFVEKGLYDEGREEHLWPFSNAPYIRRQRDIPIASFEGSGKGKEEYRKYLAAKYGKRKMTFSGIHYNYSFPDDLLVKAFAASETVDLRDFKNQLYLHLAKSVLKYSWLLVFLTAASPVYDESVEWDGAYGTDRFDHYASRRNSEKGYWNDFIPFLSYETVEGYVEGIETYLKKGLLKSSSELYLPVRVKPKGINSLENLRKTGIDHIELRMLDLNPLTRLGVQAEDLYFIHYFLMFLTAREMSVFQEAEQLEAIKNHKRGALYEQDEIFILSGEKEIPIQKVALEILDEMETFYEELGIGDAVHIIGYQKEKLQDPGKRYAVQIFQMYRHAYVKEGLQLARTYRKGERSYV